MWCGRKNCLLKTEFAKTMADRRAGKVKEDDKDDKMSKSDDFRIALSAMLSEADFVTIKDQFLKD